MPHHPGPVCRKVSAEATTFRPMATPERTPYGTWRARWRENGKQRTKTFKRKVDAERFLIDKLADLQRGIYTTPVDKSLTVAGWSAEWLAGAHQLRPGGRKAYRKDLDSYILPALGEFALHRLTSKQIDDWIGDLAARVAPGTVAHAYRTLRAMLNVAVRRHKLAVSPLVDVQAPRVPPKEMRFLTATQLDALADAIDPRYRAWVLIAGYGGLRWGELAGLRRPAVDVDGCRVHVTEQLIDGRREEPKSAASRRWVGLPTSIRPALVDHLERFAGPELVFTSKRGTPLGHSNFRGRYWLPACLAVGLAVERDGKITGAPRVHDLRHTAVALAIATGAHPKAIQARMGHSQIAVTLDRYGHLFPSLDADIADGLDLLRG